MEFMQEHRGEQRVEGEVFFEQGLDIDTAALQAAAVHGGVHDGIIDWRKISTPVKNQAQCGSCWAHAVVEIIESAVAKSGKGLHPLAPQQLVDCNTESNSGCKGGNVGNALAYYQTHGTTLASTYPYKAKNGTCKIPSGKGPIVKTFGQATPQCNDPACDSQAGEDDMVKALALYGPLAIVIDAGKLQHYSGGVMTPKSGCKHTWDAQDHAVVLVGYNPTKKYWLVRNSWGASWGESGYFRMSYGENTCGISDYTQWVTVSTV